MNWVSTGSGNGLAPNKRQANTGTNADLLSIGPLGINFSDNLIAIPVSSFKKILLKMPPAKWRPSCQRGDELKYGSIIFHFAALEWCGYSTSLAHGKTSCLFLVIWSVDVNVLTTQGAEPSTAMILTQLSKNIHLSGPPWITSESISQQ